MEIKDGRDYLPQIKELLIEYTKSLDRDLSFQDINDELSDPAAKYAPPKGGILAAVENDKVLGMVCYRRHTAVRCEMKRLYVKPEARGLRLGDDLVKAILSHAGNAGYKEMVLDTLAPMKAAIHLYKKHGFKECEPYYENPMDDVLYMKKDM